MFIKYTIVEYLLIQNLWLARYLAGELRYYESAVTQEEEIKDQEGSANYRLQMRVLVKVCLQGKITGGNKTQKDHVWDHKSKDPDL